MNILFWCERYLPFIGGVEVLAAELISHLRGMGHTFAVITCSDGTLPDEETVEGVPVYRFPFHGPLFNKDLSAALRLCARVRELKRTLNPDVVHVNTTQPSIFYQMKTRNSIEAATIVTIHPSLRHAQASPFSPSLGREPVEAIFVTAVDDPQYVHRHCEKVQRDPLPQHAP